MTIKAFMAVLADLHNREEDVLNQRSNRYSKFDDVMHNFKAISKITQNKPPIVAFQLLMKHFVALSDFLLSYDSKKYDDITPEEFKQIEEYIIDIRNYLALIYAMLYEVIEVDD